MPSLDLHLPLVHVQTCRQALPAMQLYDSTFLEKKLPALGQVLGDTLISDLEGAWGPWAGQSLGGVIGSWLFGFPCASSLPPPPQPQHAVSSRGELCSLLVPSKLFLLHPHSGWTPPPPGSLLDPG